MLVADSEAHWREYLEEVAARQSQEDEEERSEVSPPELGDWVCLEGVDYTRQVEVRGMQVVFHDDAHRQPWAVLIDHQFSALIELGSQVEASFGFDRSTTWDLVGRVAGFDFVFDDLAFRSRKVPTARVNALFRPGQFVVFHHPKQGPMVPGLEAAQDKLGAIHARLAIPNAKEPSELLDTFLTIIETGNLPRFRELSMPSADARMLRRRFEVFVKVLDACGGRVAFDRYDEDRSPKSPGPDGEVKMFVERTNADGTTTSRPLTFVKVDGRWRLKAGMI